MSTEVKTADDLSSMEGASLDALAAVIRVERLLAQKRREYDVTLAEATKVRAAHGQRMSNEWVARSQQMMDAASERAEKEGLTRWMP